MGGEWVMIEIAVVEDDAEQAALLDAHIRRYAAENQLEAAVSVFSNAIAFLENYTASYHIVYMDIMMPMMNGMDAARLLREKDEKVILVFVTSMRQYAIQGYEVSAADFIVKPVSYSEFALKFTKLLDRVDRSREDALLLKSDNGFIRLDPRSVAYVEVKGHHCIYHTEDGEYRQYQTIKSAEATLAGYSFLRCNNYLLVNPAYVTRLEGLTVFVGDAALPISHPRRKAFTDALNRYMEGKPHVY